MHCPAKVLLLAALIAAWVGVSCAFIQTQPVAALAPGAAQRVALSPASAGADVCAGCLAYLVFPPLEAEASIDQDNRQQVTPPTTAWPERLGLVVPVASPGE